MIHIDELIDAVRDFTDASRRNSRDNYMRPQRWAEEELAIRDELRRRLAPIADHIDWEEENER